jgi:hypothetical protein
MTGRMREAQDGTATIHDIDIDSFTRFAEYIYGGDYNMVQPIVKSEQREDPQFIHAYEEPAHEEPAHEEPAYEEPAVEEPPMEDLDWALPTKTRKKGARMATPKQTLLSLADYSFRKPLTEVFPVVPTGTFASTESAGDDDTPGDFTEVLLCHARVYSMADQFQVSKLKELAIYKIYMLLRQINDSDDCHVSNLVSILDFVYGHTMDLESTEEPLRDLLAHYVAWDFRGRMEEEDFKAYLAKNGAFTLDVCEKVSMRL